MGHMAQSALPEDRMGRECSRRLQSEPHPSERRRDAVTAAGPSYGHLDELGPGFSAGQREPEDQ